MVAAPEATPASLKLSLSCDANFDSAQVTLTTDARHGLDTFLSAAGGRAFNTVEVNGYTDSTASDSYNLRLSTQREQNVAQYLQDHGLKARQFLVKGYGKSNPAVSNASASGRAQIRCVEIVLN